MEDFSFLYVLPYNDMEIFSFLELYRTICPSSQLFGHIFSFLQLNRKICHSLELYWKSFPFLEIYSKIRHALKVYGKMFPLLQLYGKCVLLHNYIGKFSVFPTIWKYYMTFFHSYMGTFSLFTIKWETLPFFRIICEYSPF